MNHTCAAVAALFAAVYLGCGGTTGADVVACGRDAGAAGSSASPTPTPTPTAGADADAAPTAATTTPPAAATSGTSSASAPPPPPPSPSGGSSGGTGGAFCTPAAACGGLWTCSDPCYAKVDDGTRCCTIECDCNGDPNDPTTRFECVSHC